jgi:hypothetical protein
MHHQSRRTNNWLQAALHYPSCTLPAPTRPHACARKFWELVLRMLHISAIFASNTPTDLSLSYPTQTKARNLNGSLKQSSLSSSLVPTSTVGNMGAELVLRLLSPRCLSVTAMPLEILSGFSRTSGSDHGRHKTQCRLLLTQLKIAQLSRNLITVNKMRFPNAATKPVIWYRNSQKLDLHCCVTCLDYVQLMATIFTNFCL